MAKDESGVPIIPTREKWGIPKECPIKIVPGQTRYKNEDLEIFRKLLCFQLEVAEFDRKNYTEAVTGLGLNGTEDTAPTFKVLQEGQGVWAKEESGKLAARQILKIRKIKAALARIETKTYGIDPSGVLISPERLWAVPITGKDIDPETGEKRE